jgi:uncharacterized protein
MENYNPVGWFEIPVSDIERAKAFYEKVLEISLRRQDISDYQMVWLPGDQHAKGISGALMKGDGYHPAKGGTVIYFVCPDIEAALARVEASGGSIFLHKKDIGEYGYIGWFVDTEGNIIGLHTSK